MARQAGPGPCSPSGAPREPRLSPVSVRAGSRHCPQALWAWACLMLWGRKVHPYAWSWRMSLARAGSWACKAPPPPLTTLGHLRFPRCLPSLEGDDLTSAWHEERRKKDLE